MLLPFFDCFGLWQCIFGTDPLFTLVGSKAFEIKDLEEVGRVRSSCDFSRRCRPDNIRQLNDTAGRKLNSQSHLIITIFCGSKHESTLRAIPTFFIRKYNVERFNPRRAAAPFDPESTHLVSFRVFRIWLRSTSSRV